MTMALTKCNRCNAKSTSKKVGENCGQTDWMQEHPCMGSMRPVKEGELRIWHLIEHMDIWELHMRKLERQYTRERSLEQLVEIRSDIKKLRQWRRRLALINPRRNRKTKVSELQSSIGAPVSNQ